MCAKGECFKTNHKELLAKQKFYPPASTFPALMSPKFVIFSRFWTYLFYFSPEPVRIMTKRYAWMRYICGASTEKNASNHRARGGELCAKWRKSSKMVVGAGNDDATPWLSHMWGGGMNVLHSI